MADTLRYPPNIATQIVNGAIEIAGAGYKVVDPATTDLTTLSKVGVKGFYFVYGKPTFPDQGQCIEGFANGYIRSYVGDSNTLLFQGNYTAPSLLQSVPVYEIPSLLVTQEVHGYQKYYGGYFSSNKYADVAPAQFVKAGPLGVAYDTKSGSEVYLWMGPVFNSTPHYYFADATWGPVGFQETFYLGSKSGDPLSILPHDYGAPDTWPVPFSLYETAKFLFHAYEYAAGFSIGWPSNVGLPDTCIASVPSDDNPCNAPNVLPLAGSTGYGPGSNNYVADVAATTQGNEPSGNFSITSHDSSGPIGDFISYKLLPHEGAFGIAHYVPIPYPHFGNYADDPLSDPAVSLTVGGSVIGTLECGDAVFIGPTASYYNLSKVTFAPGANTEQATAVRFVCRQKHTNKTSPRTGIVNDYWQGKIYYAYIDLDPHKGDGGGSGSGDTGDKVHGVDLLNTRTGLYIADDIGGIRVQRAPTAFQPGFTSTLVDGDGSCRLPQLLAQEEGNGIVCVYRKGTGHKADPAKPDDKDDPWQWFRRTSYDKGMTWTPEKDAKGKEIPLVKSDASIKWLRHLLNKRNRETLLVYNDGSGKSVPADSKDGKEQPDGTGLLMVDIMDATGKLIGTFPEDGKGILGMKSDDAAFDVEYIRDSTHDIRVVFISGGKVVYALTLNECRDWKDITGQMTGS